MADQLARVELLMAAETSAKEEVARWEERETAAGTAKQTEDNNVQAKAAAVQDLKDLIDKRSWIFPVLLMIDSANF